MKPTNNTIQYSNLRDELTFSTRALVEYNITTVLSLPCDYYYDYNYNYHYHYNYYYDYDYHYNNKKGKGEHLL